MKANVDIVSFVLLMVIAWGLIIYGYISSKRKSRKVKTLNEEYRVETNERHLTFLKMLVEDWEDFLKLEKSPEKRLEIESRLKDLREEIKKHEEIKNK